MSKLILLFVITPQLLFSQKNAVEINDRVNLPQAVYDSLSSYSLILCGEFHGTNESPQFIEGLIKLWIRSGQKVTAALEIPESNQQVIDSFMNSGDFSLLEKMPFFNSEFKDGRSSMGMAKLIENLYKQGNIKILCFDTKKEITSGQERDSLMSVNILNCYNNFPGYKIILLSGNIHSMLRQGYGDHPDYKTMGYFLSQDILLSQNKIIALNIIYGSGTAWNCMKDGCKERVIEGYSSENLNFYSTSENFFYLYKDPSSSVKTGYNGILCSRHITASKPLKE